MQKVVALYTKEPRPTDNKIQPVELETIPEEPKVRAQADRAEQLSLFSAEELAELQRPLDSRPPQGDERTRRVRGDAVQDKLPGF
jgi:hypothetical protein